MKILIGIAIMMVLAATACDGAVMTMEGPDSVAVDGRAWYEVTITDLTAVGVVNYYPYVDLNEDGVFDLNEWITEYLITELVDSRGESDTWFFLEPDEYFDDRELDVPEEVVVAVYAEFYVSPDNVYEIGTVSSDLEITEEE